MVGMEWNFSKKKKSHMFFFSECMEVYRVNLISSFMDTLALMSSNATG